jgi:hypothetical protein
MHNAIKKIQPKNAKRVLYSIQSYDPQYITLDAHIDNIIEKQKSMSSEFILNVVADLAALNDNIGFCHWDFHDKNLLVFDPKDKDAQQKSDAKISYMFFDFDQSSTEKIQNFYLVKQRYKLKNDTPDWGNFTGKKDVKFTYNYIKNYGFLWDIFRFLMAIHSHGDTFNIDYDNNGDIIKSVIEKVSGYYDEVKNTVKSLSGHDKDFELYRNFVLRMHNDNLHGMIKNEIKKQKGGSMYYKKYKKYKTKYYKLLLGMK